jgi:uncharacterized repeat protein (TIGR01451 family)
MSIPSVPKKTRQRTRPIRFMRANRSGAAFIVIALLAMALFSASAATFNKHRAATPASRSNPDTRSNAGSERSSSILAGKLPKERSAADLLSLSALPPLPLLPAPDAITLYAEDCTTPKSAFTLGDTVCAIVSGGPDLTFVKRRLVLGDSAGFLRDFVDPDSLAPEQSIISITSDPQTVKFKLPTEGTTVVGGETVDNRGVWKVNSIHASRYSVRTSTVFTVSDPDPAKAVANLEIYNSSNTNGLVGDGSAVAFALWLRNEGPDAATNVQVTDMVPANTTFVSQQQESGPSFNCTNPTVGSSFGTTTCTIASLPARTSVRLTLVYNLTPGLTPGMVITNTANITSETNDLYAPNNSETASVTVTSAAEGSCTLSCPSDIVTNVSTTDGNGNPGAIVTFGAAEGAGSCGAISSTPVSGSFFPVGTTTVFSSGAGGASCSFNVTVNNSSAPTISCPGPITKAAADGACAADVTLATPTATGSGVTVDGERSDGKDLTDPFPGGVTTITWTATDTDNRRASCTQTVTITVDDTTPPTITAPPDVTRKMGANASTCSVGVSEEALGLADADDNCSTPKVTRTGVPAGNIFPKGETIVTYTVTDGAGLTATATQKVTIVDDSPPIIFAPADASYSCVSDVPAASASQAIGPKVDGNGRLIFDDNGQLEPGGPVFDNCGTPIITVSETRSGAGTSSSDPLLISRTFTATDSDGNSSSVTQTITVVDSTPPTISCPANITVYLPLNSTATSTVVSYQTPVGTDSPCGGATTAQTAGLPSGASFPVGTTTNTFKVTDAVGNTAECSFNVTVLYDFTGFFSPVNNLPTVNVVNAGKAIPVKFSLSGNKGLNIFAANSPQSGVILCDASAPATDLTMTVTAGSSSLSYDATTDQYIYVWKTDSSWAGTCRQLVVTLNDGSAYTAYFKFK